MERVTWADNARKLRKDMGVCTLVTSEEAVQSDHGRDDQIEFEMACFHSLRHCRHNSLDDRDFFAHISATLQQMRLPGRVRAICGSME